MEVIKCVTVGDRAVGKTFMLNSYVNNYTPKECFPTIFDKCSTTIKIGGKLIRLELWDTAAHHDKCDSLRKLVYPRTDIVLVCFSVTAPDSFKNIELKWIPEIKKYCPQSKIILVGTKYDLYDNPETLELLKMTNETPVNFMAGFMLADKIGAVRYVECSAITQVGLSRVFAAAAEAVLSSPTRVKRRRMLCSIL